MNKRWWQIQNGRVTFTALCHSSHFSRKVCSTVPVSKQGKPRNRIYFFAIPSSLVNTRLKRWQLTILLYTDFPGKSLHSKYLSYFIFCTGNLQDSVLHDLISETIHCCQNVKICTGKFFYGVLICFYIVLSKKM